MILYKIREGDNMTLNELARELGIKPHRLDYPIDMGYIPRPTGWPRAWTPAQIKEVRKFYDAKAMAMAKRILAKNKRELKEEAAQWY
jgi:hypothetical protein